ncbi:unnamed protein product [Durusdinium trenchii]|uniref:Uncharacterized protein n=1 Tax=Durusdinium trenchii TaxID=1381693 RepID=A0ABP0R2Y5_9DINO
MGARPSRTAVVDSTEGNSLVEELNVAPSNVEADAVEKATKQDINSYPHSTKDMLHIKARVARAFAELGPDRLSDKGLSDCSSHSNEKNLKKTKLQIPTCPKLQQAVLLCSSICHICHWFVAVLGGGLLFFFYFVFNFHWPVAAAAARVHFRLEGCTTNLTNVNVSCQYKLSVGLSRMDRFASVAPEDIVALPQYWPTIEEEARGWSSEWLILIQCLTKKEGLRCWEAMKTLFGGRRCFFSMESNLFGGGEIFRHSGEPPPSIHVHFLSGACFDYRDIFAESSSGLSLDLQGSMERRFAENFIGNPLEEIHFHSSCLSLNMEPYWNPVERVYNLIPSCTWSLL